MAGICVPGVVVAGGGESGAGAAGAAVPIAGAGAMGVSPLTGEPSLPDGEALGCSGALGCVIGVLSAPGVDGAAGDPGSALPLSCTGARGAPDSSAQAGARASSSAAQRPALPTAPCTLRH